MCYYFPVLVEIISKRADYQFTFSSAKTVLVSEAFMQSSKSNFFIVQKGLNLPRKIAVHIWLGKWFFFFSPFFRKDLIFLPWFKKTNSKRISKVTWVTHSFIISIFAFYFHFRWFQTGMSWPILMIFLDSVKRNMLHELYIKKMVHMSGGKTF